ncbi:hypothetical protein [Polaromonas sp.]|uniref:NMCC_0638 family (lipo)protein n=1 Tax=Polaromonas sp. TaxID=1869339 RepID=UPI0025E54D47|nr:hypothetical protein [Polaromonas sp.]
MYSLPISLSRVSVREVAKTAVLMLALVTATVWSQTPVDVRPAQHAMKRFMQLCMGTVAERITIEEAAQQLGLQRLEPQAAARFAGSADAPVWVEQNEFGYFAVSAKPGNLCSVYARKVDAAALTSAFKTWLPPRESGYQTDALPIFSNRNQTTITYNIRRNGEPFAVWSLSTSTVENSIYQGVISMKKF